MKNSILFILCFLFVGFGLQNKGYAQNITVHQYRHVPADKVGEFIYKETTYWSEVAQKALDKGNLQFWGLFEKVGGFDLPNSSNFLFINTFKDIDDMAGTWNPSEVFPDVPASEMETFSISTVTSQLYLRGENFIQSTTAGPGKYNYIKFNYINSSSPAQLIALEAEHWAPFIKAEMEKEGTSQVAWGNVTILSPQGDNIKANTISFDIFPTLQEALAPKWDENVVFPEQGLVAIDALELNRRGEAIYRIVKVVTNGASE